MDLKHTHPNELFGGLWWLLVAIGTVALAAGILAIAYPHKTLTALGIFFGIYLLFAGASQVFLGLFGEVVGSTSRVLVVLLGIVGLIAGVLVLRHPGKSLVIIALAFGIYLIIAGVTTIIRATEARRSETPQEHRGHSVFTGVIYILGGIIVVAWPAIGGLALALIIGITLIITGVSQIIAGIRLHGLQSRGGGPRAVAH